MLGSCDGACHARRCQGPTATSLTLRQTCHQHLQQLAGAHIDLWRQCAGCCHWAPLCDPALTRGAAAARRCAGECNTASLVLRRLGMKGMDAFMDTSDLVDDADLKGQPSGLQPVRSFGQQEAAKLLSNMEGGLQQRCL